MKKSRIDWTSSGVRALTGPILSITCGPVITSENCLLPSCPALLGLQCSLNMLYSLRSEHFNYDEQRARGGARGRPRFPKHPRRAAGISREIAMHPVGG